MKVRVNGKPEECDDGTSIAKLVRIRGFDPKKVVVEYNGSIVAGTQWGKTALKENDELEVLSFVGGG